MVSWLIAFREYCFQVPANRIGSFEFTVAQLKTIQEVSTLTVFSVFSVLYLKEQLRWNYFGRIRAGGTRSFRDLQKVVMRIARTEPPAPPSFASRWSR